MKAHINRQPDLVTYLEPNEKHGHGWQARQVIDGVSGAPLDYEPFTLGEVTGMVSEALDIINTETGYNYKVHEVIRITQEGLDANKATDFAAAKLLKDIADGTHTLARPHKVDVEWKEVDGKQEPCFSGRGTVLVAYFSWLDDKMPKAMQAMKRYCEYIALHGAGGATGLFGQLEAMDKDAGSEWIKDTYARYVTDDAAVIRYILG